LRRPSASSQTSAKRAEIKATKMICRILGVRSSAETRTTGADLYSTELAVSFVSAKAKSSDKGLSANPTMRSKTAERF
jgi:hypothetical protein